MKVKATIPAIILKLARILIALVKARVKVIEPELSPLNTVKFLTPEVTSTTSPIVYLLTSTPNVTASSKTTLATY